MMPSENKSLVENERRLALVIGVNEAPQSHLGSLNYALNDAESMAQTLQEQCGFTLLMPPLLGADATSANVKKAVLALARQRTDNDFLLLYFSGHGQPMPISGGQSDIYLVTSDFSETDTEEDETLHCSMRWLQGKLYLPTQAGKVLLVLDCCYAGNMGRTAPDPYLADLKARIGKYFGAPGEESDARASGLRFALTATGHNQSASEQEGHGVMTGRLLKCLQGDVDDVINLDDRGNVSLQRLYEYLLRVMPADQNPSVAGDSAGRDCILARYEQRAIELRQRKRTIVNEVPRSYIPLARSPSFQKRPGEFDAVARMLFADETGRVSPQTRVVGLIGMGGIGKTQLAVEIAYEYKERFVAGIFWMTAIGTSLLEWQRQFAELAANAEYLPADDDVSHLENEARRARHIARYFALHSDALLLLDNVERIEHLLDALTTLAGEEVHCTVLYTSRTDVAPLSVQIYQVRRLPDEGALRLLLMRRPAFLKHVFADVPDQETQAARDICLYVEGLPLALTLLRDLLQDTHLTFVYLNKQLRQRGALDITREGDVTDARLFRTFLLSWQKVRNPDVQRFFQLASFFPEAAPIPLWLLALAANLAGNTSLEPLGKARIELVHRSLIEELPGDAIRLHPLIREFARHLVSLDDGRDALLAEARERLTREFTDVNKLERRVLDEGYWTCLERVQEVVKYGQLLGIKQTDLLERVEYWLARDSSLLGTGTLWPQVLPGIFYQQLHNRALEEGYKLSGAEPDTRWVRQLARVGAENQSLLREFRHPYGVTCVAFSPDSRLVVTGCEDYHARIWDASSGQVMHVLQGHSNPITGIAFSPDGSPVVTCSLDADALLWDALNGQVIRTFHGHEAGIREVTFSPDGKYIATGSIDKTVRVWDVATGEMVALLVEHNGWSGGLAFSPDSKQIAISTPTGISIWDRESEQMVVTLGSNRRLHWGIVFSSDGKSVLTASQYGIYLWDIRLPEISAPTFKEYFSSDATYDLLGTAFSAEGKLVAMIRNNIVDVFQMQSMQLVLSCGHSTKVASVAFSLDNTKVVTGSSDGNARIWNIMPASRAVVSASMYNEIIECAAFLPTDMQLVTLSSRILIRVWSFTDGEVVRMLQMEGGGWTDYVALSPDGRRVAIGLHSGIRIEDIEQNQDVILYIPLELPLGSERSCIALSIDGSSVAVAADQVVKVWSLDGQKVIALLGGHEGDIKQMVFSPDSNKLVTGATDGTVRIWDVGSSTQLAVLKGYAGRSIGISPDGRLVANALFSNAIQVSSMDDGRRLMTLERHTQPVTMLSFSPASQSLLSADQSGQVFFWRIEIDGQVTRTPLGVYFAANEIGAVYWQDEQHVILADLGGMQNHPHFYHLALDGLSTHS